MVMGNHVVDRWPDVVADPAVGGKCHFTARFYGLLQQLLAFATDAGISVWRDVGIGNINYGLTMRYLGMSMGIGIAIGITLVVAR